MPRTSGELNVIESSGVFQTILKGLMSGDPAMGKKGAHREGGRVFESGGAEKKRMAGEGCTTADRFHCEA